MCLQTNVPSLHFIKRNKWTSQAGPATDISAWWHKQPSGKKQETDMDVKSSHATLKTARKATQNAFLHLCHTPLGAGPEMTQDEAYQHLSLPRLHGAAAISQWNIIAATFWASASWLIGTDQVKTDHLSLRQDYNYTGAKVTFSTDASAEKDHCQIYIVWCVATKALNKYNFARWLQKLYTSTNDHTSTLDRTRCTHCLYLLAIQS